MQFMENCLNLPLSEVLRIIQNRMMNESTYFGIKTYKSPMDFWIYQEIIFETKPDVIIEIGNFRGGSSLALAHICDGIGKGKVIGVDISHEQVPDLVKNHPRITLIEMDACEAFGRVKGLIKETDHVLIVEDSSHTFENTLNVLDTYSELVRPGDFFIVEDGICHHGLDIGPNPGPYEAVSAFLEKNKHFDADRSRESFLITWNPKGYLKRVR
jgi:cephalosporin hydroxylase